MKNHFRRLCGFREVEEGSLQQVGSGGGVVGQGAAARDVAPSGAVQRSDRASTKGRGDEWSCTVSGNKTHSLKGDTK